VTRSSFFRLLFFVFLFCLINCNPEPPREAKLILVGESAWFEPYKSLSESNSYLLKNYTQESKLESIEWPPKDLRRLVDISVDVTGSCYNTLVTYNNEVIPLAKYNLLKLCEKLEAGNILLPGDNIILRLFGSNYGDSGANGRESKGIQIPPMRIETEIRVLTRKHNDLELLVKKVISDKFSINATIEDLRKWFMPFVTRSAKPNERYKESPFLEHVKRVVEESLMSKSVRKVFIFVTDGWFQVGNPNNILNFQPSIFDNDKSIINKIIDFVQRSNLKPSAEACQNTSIYLIGLNDGGNPEFRKAQRDLFTWFFEPQKISIIEY